MSILFILYFVTDKTYMDIFSALLFTINFSWKPEVPLSYSEDRAAKETDKTSHSLTADLIISLKALWQMIQIKNI